MGAERNRRGRASGLRRRTAGFGGLAVSAALLAGCASMPDSGEVTAVDSSQRADADSQVRVYGVPPHKGERPQELVTGFLEATTSDDPDYGTARMYLAKGEQRRWDPSWGTVVLAEPPQVQVERTGDGDRDYTITLIGKQVARIDAKHAYKPEEGAYKERIHVAREGGEWRIDRLPPGLVLGLADFQRIYRSVNKYYFAELGTSGSGKGRDVLVADPVYLRKRIDPVTSTVNALLDGPTNWLDPVAATAFPTGTKVVDRRLSVDDSNALRIRLNGKAAGTNQAQCLRMAAQLLYTVQDQSAKVGQVVLQRDNGSQLCSLGREEARKYAPDQAAGRGADQQYFVDAQHRMVSLADGDEEARRVPGPFGADGAVQLRSVGVDRSEHHAAGVAANGQALYVTRLETGSALGEPRVTARGGAKAGLTAPSWDGLGDLWVADQDPERPRLLRLPGGTGSPEEVQVPRLDGRITGLRVAADGVRIALLVTKDDRTSLKLGRVERHGGAGRLTLSVQELRSVAPRLEQVDAVSWAGGSRLLVAGNEQGGLQQLQYIDTDGSLSNTSALPGITGVRGVAASESTAKAPALVAERDGGIVRLLPDSNWKLVTKEGSAPVYPG
ncbi:LpqB family beta-propeller domain-containing protein [Streptomyces telluris]|uniref:LpqB family beta-propeller domain-containing protein n=1 Tax=Streptomyces telluris TaxID=2720021 RepID=A0A9X2LPV5_9ACTN|nr:LpqB family beta-propeller domain-containing protein [Streptomyces telluris]MCQ8775060.1 LpqB family beta-propeller domain-containing protein [Streptomyces telluris]